MRLRRTTAIWAMAAALASAAQAQLPLNPEAGTANSSPQNEIGGTATIDVITLREGMFGIPLRYAGVLVNSERVEFGGRVLRKGEDFQIDYAAGVVYLMRAVKQGEVLRVGYRYDAAKAAEARQRNQFAGFTPFKFEIAPGALKMLVGFGMTERQQDGNILQTNLYGWNNTFQFGSSKLNGLLLLGNRQRVENGSDYEYRAAAGQTELGRSHFALQNMVIGLGASGSIEVNYQDISKNFTGFAAAADAGYTEAQLAQLQKERGLKRFQLGMKDADLGGIKLSGNFKTVDDADDGIGWQSIGLSAGGFHLKWDSQKVGDTFKRFNDLAEGDREQLKKELGMERESLAGGFAHKATKLNFSVRQITDPENAAIDRRELNFDSTGFKFWYGDQHVDSDFRRMQSLKGDEQALWGREVGMSRQWFGLQAKMFGVGQPIHFSQSILASQLGQFEATDLKWTGSGWSLEHVERNASAGFTSFNAMQDAERNEHINSIGRMYDPNGVPFRGEEVGWFNRSTGISRGLSRFQAQLFGGWKVNFDRLDLRGRTDSATVDTFKLSGHRLAIDFRHQELGEQFGELANLLELERNRLGPISGLERTDFNASYQLNPNRSFLYSKMAAESPAGGASRERFAYRDPRLQIEMNQREVDSGFVNVNQLVDPEKDFLAAMRGFSARDAKVSWQISPNLKFDMFLLNSASASLDQTKYIHNYELNWRPDRATSIVARRHERSDQDPVNLLFANSVDFMALQRDFGRLGKFSYLTESKDYEGVADGLADSERRYMGWETKLNPKTSFRAEQSSTRFDDGKKEDVQSNSVTTELSKNLGVSVSQIAIDREGEDRDEKKRNYGFWYTFGNGLKLAYGYALHRAGETGLDTRNQNVQLTGGQVGNVQVGNGTYTENNWEGDRTQAMGNISLATVKPMRFFGITNLKIQASLDTAADRSVWLKENQFYSIAGNLGSNAFGIDYRSQIAPNGFRGIDRSVFFTTDQNEKRPFRFNLKYKQRDLPTGETVIIRDYSIVAKPGKNFELSHNLLTHPEVARGDVILGSITQARRENRWKLEFKQNANLQIGGEWREFMDQGQPMTRLGGLNLTFNKAIGSPLSVFYGVEESDAGGQRKRTDRYHLKFDQRAGPHQQFSFFIGNVSYLKGFSQQGKKNLTVQLDYQLKF